jgi:CSLREA domain-containing protein
VAPLSILRRPAPLLVVGLLATVLVGTARTGAPPAGAAPTILVTSNVDDADLAPGDGVCASAFNGCTLRAAIQEAVASPGTVVLSVVPFFTGVHLLIMSLYLDIQEGSR